MGAFVDGELGILSAPPEKLWEVIGFSFWGLSHDKPSNKMVLMIMGRFVRCFEFRRPLMSLLRKCWPRGPVHQCMPWMPAARRSLVRACIMLAMAVADLRAPVDGLVTASDASEKGGGLCVSMSLTDEGRANLRALQSPSFQSERCLPFRSAGAMPASDNRGPRVFVLSLFDGIGAAMVALSTLPCRIVGFAASEIDKECKRLVRRRWPGVLELGGVQSVDEKVVGSILMSLGFDVDIILIIAGSPCQDLTALLAGRQGLQGSRSRLFFEIPRIIKLCQQLFGPKVWFMVENVDSMTLDSKKEFSTVLGVQPVLIQAHALTPVRRPRLYWCSWPVNAGEGESLVDDGVSKKWHFPEQTQVMQHWEDEGWHHLGKGPLPTFTRALPRQRPPAQPAGLEHASNLAQLRWQQDRYRFQVYQYEDAHLLWREGVWRLPSISERERLMGFSEGYISEAIPPKLSKDAAFNLGCCMIGNTFHVPSIKLLFYELIRHVDKTTPVLTRSELLAKPTPAPAGWTKYPCFVKTQPDDPLVPELVHEVMRQGERAGSDIRLDLGVPFRVKAYPRAGLRTSLFTWRIVHGYTWQHQAHINCLELQALINSMQWRLRKLTGQRKRVLHLVDSQVVASVVAKGRTSSFRLRKGIQRLNSLLVASGIKLSVAFIHSTDNPADIPSRWADRPKKNVSKGVKALRSKRR